MIGFALYGGDIPLQVADGQLRVIYVDIRHGPCLKLVTRLVEGSPLDPRCGVGNILPVGVLVRVIDLDSVDTGSCVRLGLESHLEWGCAMQRRRRMTELNISQRTT